MRKTVVLILALFVVGLPAIAQQQAAPERIVVDTSLLTAEQLEQARVQQKVQQVTQVVEGAGTVASNAREVGHAVGIAIDGGLTAITKHAAEFGKTDVGRFTMFLIAWKLMAEDVINVGGGLVKWLIWFAIFVLFSIALFWSYRRNCVPRQVVVEETRESGFFGKRTRRYETYVPNGDINSNNTGDWGPWPREAWMLSHGALFVLLMIISGCAACGGPPS